MRVCACVRVGVCVHGSYQYVHVDWKSHRHDELRRLLGKVLQLCISWHSRPHLIQLLTGI